MLIQRADEDATVERRQDKKRRTAYDDVQRAAMYSIQLYRMHCMQASIIIPKFW